jgi:hypothetical protein
LEKGLDFLGYTSQIKYNEISIHPKKNKNRKEIYPENGDVYNECCVC